MLASISFNYSRFIGAFLISRIVGSAGLAGELSHTINQSVNVRISRGSG